MPTYQNNGSAFVTLQGTRVNPGDTFATTSILENTPEGLPQGVVRTSNSPYYNPIILSQVITSTQTIDVPAGYEQVRLVLYVVSGNWAIQFNDSSASASMNLATGQTDVKKFMKYTLGLIVATLSSGSGSLEVRMELA